MARIDPRQIEAPSPESHDWVEERIRRSKEKVIAATHVLLTKQGFAGVSVDEISKQAGVAKATIYRHWPNRTALLLEACATLDHKPSLPDTGTFRGDVEKLVRIVISRLKNDNWPKVLPSIIDAAERDAAIADVHSKMHEGMTAPFRMITERAKARGEISKEANSAQIVSIILGPCFYRRWFSRDPLDEAFAEFVVESAMAVSSKL